MSDTASHAAPQPDAARHTLTVRDVEVMLAEAGVPRSHRHVLRLCQSGMLDAKKVPGGPSGEEWYIASQSVPKAIGDLKQIEAMRARRSPPQPAMTYSVAEAEVSDDASDVPRHDAPQPVAAQPETQENNHSRTAPAPDTSRHGATDLDVYEHPYVKRLETEVDKWQGKYETQVRRTEEIQLKHQERLVELQRMTTIGQSKTLADFMLQAKNWIVGADGGDSPPLASDDARPTGQV